MENDCERNEGLIQEKGRRGLGERGLQQRNRGDEGKS